MKIALTEGNVSVCQPGSYARMFRFRELTCGCPAARVWKILPAPRHVGCMGVGERIMRSSGPGSAIHERAPCPGDCAVRSQGVGRF